MFEFETPYLDMYRTMRIKRSPRPKALHHKTCPDCGRKRVNLYYSAESEKWTCKECLDKEKQNDKT